MIVSRWGTLLDINMRSLSFFKGKLDTLDQKDELPGTSSLPVKTASA